MTLDKEGYKNTLVYTYCCEEQGIYEVGEVSKSNCTNDYPYAMAFKRCFDRVVLKKCKLAYAGVYSDSEAEEFTNNRNEERINKGDCREAKRCYNTWKSQTGETNAEIEKMIRECFAQNPEKDPEYEPVPNTSLLITKKPVAKRVTFVQAMEKCAELDFGGFDDWRMPTTNELFVIFATGKNHGRTFAGMSFDANNRIIRGNTTVKEYDVMRPDGTTSHRSTYSKDNLPFDCFCVRDTISE